MNAAKARNTARLLLSVITNNDNEDNDLIPLQSPRIVEDEWPKEATERLRQLTKTRRKHEKPFHSAHPQRQKVKDDHKMDNFDINGYLSTILEEKMERQEASFIIKSFKESTCRVYIPDTDPDDDITEIGSLACRVCGLTSDQHFQAESCANDQEDHSLKISELGISTNTYSTSIDDEDYDEIKDENYDEIDYDAYQLSEIFSSPSVDSTDGYSSLTRESFYSLSNFSSMCFGSMLIPARFVGQKFSNTSKEPFMILNCIFEVGALWETLWEIDQWALDQNRKYMKFDGAHGQNKLSEVADLLDLWQVSPPTFIISVTGGSLANTDEKTLDSIAESIRSISASTDLWILSNGRNAGTSRFIGRMFHSNANSTSKVPVLISLTHWGSIRRKELLMGISLPREQKSSRYFYAMEYRLARKEDNSILNPYQQVYLLLDNGEAEPGNTVRDFRTKFQEFLKNSSSSDFLHEIASDVKVPMITLVIGGDRHTLGQVMESVKSKNSVVVVNGSGLIPGLLSDLYFLLEDAFPRALNEHNGWTNREQRVFQEFIKKYSIRVRKAFKCMPLKKDEPEIKEAKKNRYPEIIRQLREVMQGRYYLMVIENSASDVCDNFYSAILQVIYKGSTRSNGLIVALNAGSPEFLDALFNRDVDPQFKVDKDYLDARSLASLHRKNFSQGGSIANVLRLINKRQTLHDSDDPCFILQNVGRIIHLLLGQKYKLLYHEPPFTEIDTADNVPIGKKRAQIWHLFLWSVLSGKPALTQFFLLRGSAQLGCALLAMKLYSGIARYASKLYEEELREYFSKASEYLIHFSLLHSFNFICEFKVPLGEINCIRFDSPLIHKHFEQVAIAILDEMYKISWTEAYRVLISEMPLEIGPYVTPLMVADDAEAKQFMQHACCQTYLQRVWKGHMGMETPTWMSFAVCAPFIVVPFIHFERHPDQIPETTPDYRRASVVHKELEYSESLWWKLKCYYTAPITKFYLRMFSYLTLLVLMSFFVLIDLKPFNEMSDITVVEWLVMFWLIAITADEVYQIVIIRDAGPLYGLPAKALNLSIWHRYEIIKMKCHILVIHLKNGWWNRIDFIMISLYIVAFSLRFSLPLRYFQLDRILFSVALILSYFRLLSFWYILKAIGPRIIAIRMMLTELTKFLMLLAVFIISFGIAFQAILHPGQEPSMSLLVSIVWRPYWQMFGELFVEEFEGMATNDNATCGGSEVGSEPSECFMWAAPVLLAVYLLISNVLLLNLLIAIFSQAYEEVQTMAHTVWLYNLYSLIEEFYYVSWLPPPLGIFHYTWASLVWCFKYRSRPRDFFPEDKFRLKALLIEHDLQKKACKEMKQLNFEAEI